MPIPLKTDKVLRERYLIKRIIGQGGMGSIYLADDLRLEGRLCAVKEVQHDSNLSAELLKQARDQFQREATVLARLDHPNLPKVSDFFSASGRDYLVMDFVPGKDIRTLMLDARRNGEFLKEDDVLNWAAQLADALHRDIKPSNLKLTPSGLVKLVDFGLVKILVSDDVTITILQGRGTALYTPLEQYGGDSGHTDGRSDIYAFGATLYHLLTNQAPVEARELFLDPAVLVAPRQLNPNISVRTENAILWAMNLHPDERPQNIEEFCQGLFGNQELHFPRRSVARKKQPHSFLSSSVDQLLAIISVAIFLLSLGVTLFR
jgi:eukaryotic-like serine/threonine-protein kinase